MAFEEIRKKAVAEWKALEDSEVPRIYVGTSTCAREAGAVEVLKHLNSELQERNINARVIEVGCIGLCYLEPMVYIAKQGRPGIVYGRVTPEIASQLINDYIVNDNPRPDLAIGTMGDGVVEGVPALSELPMLKPQVRIALRNCGYIDPGSIHQYIVAGGYSGLEKALKMKPGEVIEEIIRSGLRGRGGAGFSTGTKWRHCHDATGSEKYLICNADEGDPGAYKDRSILEGDPHSVLEGMLIGAYATGATQGYIYICADNNLAMARLSTALKQMEASGLLGENILGSVFSFGIEIREGARAFVCGEETALIRCMEGRRGMPYPRPPFPTTSGLNGKPTNVNNVETLVNAAAILQKGAAWYAGYGTDGSKGTKVFTLGGNISRHGLIEVPMGTTMRQIVEDIGGGVPDGKGLKVVLVGGPTGGCLTDSALDVPLDYETLNEAGAIMGSGSMIVKDSGTCMVDLARSCSAFTQAESCGECVLCREGTVQMLEVLTDFTEGKGKAEEIDLLVELGEGMKAGSLCSLGRTAPNPVLTGIAGFREEYEAHIRKKRCPAGVCSKLIS